MTETSQSKNVHDLAEELAAAMADMDLAAFGNIFSEDYVIWHNTDRMLQNREENLFALGEIFKNFQSLGYADIKRELTESGYVQQHLLAGKLLNGNSFEMPCCHVVKIYNLKISRIDEYFDSAPIRALTDIMTLL